MIARKALSAWRAFRRDRVGPHENRRSLCLRHRAVLRWFEAVLAVSRCHIASAAPRRAAPRVLQATSERRRNRSDARARRRASSPTSQVQAGRDRSAKKSFSGAAALGEIVLDAVDEVARELDLSR